MPDSSETTLVPIAKVRKSGSLFWSLGLFHQPRFHSCALNTGAFPFSLSEQVRSSNVGFSYFTHLFFLSRKWQETGCARRS